MYHAAKWGLEGFSEALAAELAPFGVQVMIVEPGGIRTGFTGSTVMAEPMPAYKGTPVDAMRQFSADPAATGGDPATMAARILATTTQDLVPRRLVLGSDAFEAITSTLTDRLAEISPQRENAKL